MLYRLIIYFLVSGYVIFENQSSSHYILGLQDWLENWMYGQNIQIYDPQNYSTGSWYVFAKSEMNQLNYCVYGYGPTQKNKGKIFWSETEQECDDLFFDETKPNIIINGIPIFSDNGKQHKIKLIDSHNKELWFYFSKINRNRFIVSKSPLITNPICSTVSECNKASHCGARGILACQRYGIINAENDDCSAFKMNYFCQAGLTLDCDSDKNVKCF